MGHTIPRGLVNCDNMDSAETTPRGGRKKKSTLSKLVAKKQLRPTDSALDDDDCPMQESASRTELAKILERQDICAKDSGGSNFSNRHRLESRGVRNGRSIQEEDSDEGIEIGASGSAHGSTIDDRRSTRKSHYNQLTTHDDDMSDDDDDDVVCSSSSHGEKRLHDKDSDGDDFARGLGNVRTLKKQSNTDAGLFSAKNNVGFSVGDHSEDSDVNMDSDVDADVNELRGKYEDVQHARVNASHAEKTLREDDTHDEFSPELPRPAYNITSGSVRNDFGTATSSLYNSYKHPLPTDLMSQSSTQSSSAMPQIEAYKARKRSYLVGSINSNGSMLGSEELERFFPDRKMHVFVGTWNMCDTKIVPECLDDFILPESCDFVQDIYVIGTQESIPNRHEWEVRLQETLGPQHVLMHAAAHGVLYLCVYVRRDLLWYCSVCENDSLSTRAGPASVKTKGAIAICFTIFGTSLLFINSHFAAHDGKLKERIADYKKICSGLQLPRVVINNPYHKSLSDVTAKFDAVFWCGDLNFRILNDRDHIHDAVGGLEGEGTPNYQKLVQHDELFRVMNEGLAFQDFQEGRIKFKPTYKYDVGTNTYDTKKLRIPSYTDRILFRCKKKSSATCLFYDSAQSITISDHKPVFGLFEVILRPGRDNIPLAAGQFNRGVWLEANQRRAQKHVTDVKSRRASEVCCVQ